MEPDESGVSLGDYAEEECGLVGGFDVPVDEANEFCVAYGRYLDRGDVAEAGEEPPPALDDVVDAAPHFLAEAGRDALRSCDAPRAAPCRTPRPRRCWPASRRSTASPPRCARPA